MAHNPTYPDNSYGLMQVNMLDERGYQLGAERRQRYGLQSNDQLFDPLTNMRAAKDIYDSQGLGAWSVYTSGAYKNHLPGSFTPASGLQFNKPPTAPPPVKVEGIRMAGQATGNDGPLAAALSNISKLFNR